jgi:ribosomal protein S18 acetylase RimI-like enzyme
MLNLVQVESAAQIAQARALFEEYAAWLGINLCFQNFERELAELPGNYTPPDGRLLLALDEERLAGCVALRRLDALTCEMKRLYVRPDARGKGLGRRLTEAVIEEARAAGYTRMRLDTLPSKMKDANLIYHSLGFKKINPYYNNPVDEVTFMELDLER